MKRKIMLAFFITIVAASATSAQIVNSWRDPGTTIQSPQLHKIVVGAIITDQNVRRQVEDYMVSLYPGIATQAYVVFGPEPLNNVNNNESAFNQMLKNQGYDGIVLIHQTSSDVSQHYVPGRMPSYYGTWGGYWQNRWVERYDPGTPGRVANNYTWFIQANVYSINYDKLVWSGSTQITNPGGRVPLFIDACNVLRQKMRTDGFLN